MLEQKIKEAWLIEAREKIIRPDQLATFANAARKANKTIATLNGSFDLLHSGHLFMIYEAHRQADLLLIALNSDSSIRAYKSEKRPILPLEERLLLIAGLEMVDAVTWFDETDPRAFLSIVKPDVHVNGAEYGHDCIEAATVKSFGGRLHLVPRLPLLSTSAIIEKIKTLV